MRSVATVPGGTVAPNHPDPALRTGLLSLRLQDRRTLFGHFLTPATSVGEPVVESDRRRSA
jgi:hypothetical protein